MSDIKMSDVFDIPLPENQDWIECRLGVVTDFANQEVGGAVIEAINSHDRLVEENEKLKEENEKLKGENEKLKDNSFFWCADFVHEGQAKFAWEFIKIRDFTGDPEDHIRLFISTKLQCQKVEIHNINIQSFNRV